jgi:hypothetical protein
MDINAIKKENNINISAKVLNFNLEHFFFDLSSLCLHLTGKSTRTILD